jgi:alpha-tubulin suppressor-like RCC1 family protein/C1A family cysteine protease
MESCLLPGEERDFSENNLANLHGFDNSLDDGGNADMSVAYLTRWSGPINEMDDPYSGTNHAISPTGLTEQKHIQEVLRLPDLDKNQIKNAIMNYGGVTTSMSMDSNQVINPFIIWIYDTLYDCGYRNSGYVPSYDPYDPDTHAYWDYISDDWKNWMGLDHMVTIVGWDDSYSRTNFHASPGLKIPGGGSYAAGLPAGNGAWIVKNSWGTGWGDSGYFYVSYYDQNFTRELYVFNNAETTDNYQHKYDYDTYGDVYNYGNNWMANVFTATANEPLTAVSFYALAPNTSYTIQIYTNVVGDPTNGGILQSTATTTGTVALAGYHTIPLKTPVILTMYGKFSVVVKVTSSNSSPIACEAKVIDTVPDDDYDLNFTSKATSKPGESFVSKTGTLWTDLHALPSISIKVADYDDNGRIIGYHVGGTITYTHACIKAFTRNAPTIFGQPVSQTVDAETNVTFTANVSGTSTLNYQWYYQGIAIGSNSATLTLNNVSPNNNGDYKVVVTNPLGTVTSQTATLTVRPLLPLPLLDLSGGTYSTPQNVSVFYPQEYSGVTFRYTTDGKTDPTIASPIFSPVAPLKITKTTTLKVKAFETNYTASHTVTNTYTITGIVATPTFSKPSGTYSAPLVVAISCAPPVTNAVAKITYTTDGTEPSDPTDPDFNGHIYSQAFSFDNTKDTTLKAKAWYTDSTGNKWEPSATASVTYNLSSIAKPTFSLAAGPYSAAQTVTIKCSTPGVTIRYTTDGNTTPSSTVGTIGTTVKITTNSILQAIAYRTGFNDSQVASAQYFIGTTTAPSFSALTTVNYPIGYKISITDTTDNSAVIYYTTNGSTPTISNCIQYDDATQIPLIKPMTIKAIAIATNKVASPVVSATYNVKVSDQPIIQIVADADFSPSEKTVRITCNDPDATIRYTTTTATTGITPTATSAVIKNGSVILIDHTQTIEAVSFKTGWAPSDPTPPTSYIVTTSGTVATPIITPSGNTIGSTISIICAGATIFYTTDGTTPTGDSIKYTGVPIPLNHPMVIKAKAFNTTMKSSAVATVTCNVQLPGQPEIKKVAGGNQAGAEQTVQINYTDSTDGPPAIIRYTTTTVTAGTSPTATSTVIKSGDLIQIDHTQIIEAAAFKTGWVTSAIKSVTYTVTTSGTVGTPILKTSSGTYVIGNTITIINNILTPDATIYYTTDGTTPTPTDQSTQQVGSSTLYTGPITLTQAMVLKVKAFKDGIKSSAVATGTYTPALPQPVFSPGDGTYNEEQLVQITCKYTDGTPIVGATIHYTTDKTEPTPTSPVGNTVLVNKSMTLKAKAFKAGFASSLSTSATYTINRVATPTFSVDTGTYTSTQKVTINCATTATSGHPIVIHYTLNDIDPTNTSSPTCTPGAVLTIPVTNIATTIHLKALAVEAGTTLADSNIKSADYTMTGTVATPMFYCMGKELVTAMNMSLATASANYASGIQVYISCATDGAEIHYTTDGSTPTLTSPTVNGPVLIDSSATLKAKAFITVPNWIPSAVQSEAFVIAQVAAPIINITGTTATISCVTSGAVIRYTTNGNDPSLSDPVIVSGSPIPLPMAADIVLKAKAWKTGLTPSLVTLAKMQYMLTISNDGNGSTDPSSNVTVNHTQSTNINATPNPNYHFVKWTQISGSGTAMFGNANMASTTVTVTGGDATIQATFTRNPYTLTILNDGNGSTNPSGVISVTYGASQIITATPNSGYHFVNWVQTGGTGTVAFGDPNAAKTTVTVPDGDATIQANFIAYHLLTVTNDRNGNTSPTGTITINNGIPMSLTATPKEGAEFVNWTQTAGSGTVVFGDAGLANTNVTVTGGDATIQANFTLPYNIWISGTIDSGVAKWYHFKAAIGTQYGISWNDNSDLGYTCDVKVSTYQKDLTTAYFTNVDRGYDNPSTITALEDYIYIKVEGYSSSSAGTFAFKVTPLQIMPNISAVAAGYNHSLALMSDGTVWDWGSGDQLGTGTRMGSNTGIQVNDLTNVTTIAGGGYSSLALKNDGTVWIWGDYYDNSEFVPIQISNLTGAVAIAEGGDHGLALKNDGTIWAWGFNDYGQLGNGTTWDSEIPVQVKNLTGAIAIAGGREHSLALRNDGTVWDWGENNSCQLGNEQHQTSSNIPVQVTNLTGVIAIAGGDYHSLALKNDGTVWAWGANDYGQLGNRSTNSSDFPIQVSNLTGIIAIAGGREHSLALKSDGTVWAWGLNCSGQLGNGTILNSNVPIQIGNLTDVIAIDGEGDHSLALKNDGTVWTWGDNSWGQLGNGTTINSNNPVQVLWPSLNASAIIPCRYALTVTTDGNGSVTPTGTSVTNDGVSHNITALPNKGCSFVNWEQTAGSGTVVFGNANLASTTITVSGGNATIRANFSPDHNVQYSLTVTNDGNGSTNPSGTATVHNGLSTSIIATPKAGYQFLNWAKTTGDGNVGFADSKSASTMVTTTSGNATIQASFAQQLTNGTLTTGNIVAGKSKWYVFPVTAGVHYTISTFDGWYNNSGSYTCPVRVSAYQTDLATAYYTNSSSGTSNTITSQQDYVYIKVQGYYANSTGSFAIKIVPFLNLTVTSGGHGSTYPACTLAVNDGQNTTIQAYPSTDYQFINWTKTTGTGTVVFGDANAANTTVSLTGGDATIQANFDVDHSIQYNVTIFNTGSGNITPSGTVKVNNGVSTTITATPDAGGQFIKWLQVSGMGTVVFGDPTSATTTMTVSHYDATIRADIADPLPLSTWISGNIYINKGGIRLYYFQAQVGSQYAISWDDSTEGSGTYKNCDVGVSAYQKDYTTAYFEGVGNGYKIPQIITALQDVVYIVVSGWSYTNGSSFGIKVGPALTVTSDGNGITTPLGSILADNGVSTAITATPFPGCQFANWTKISGTGTVEFGDANSANTTVTVTGGDATIQANFTVDNSIQYTLTVTNDGNGITSPPSSGSVYNGIDLPITATPNEGYQFLNWTKTAGSGRVKFDDPNSASTNVTVTSGDATIQANFALQLSFGTWTTGSIIAGGTQWYCFPATKGAQYTIRWDDEIWGTGKYTCCYPIVSAYHKDLSTAYFTVVSDGIYDSPTITAVDDYVYLLVQGKWSSTAGSFAIKVN